MTFSPEQAVQSGMRSAALFEEQAALIVRRDHPRVRTQMTRELFNELLHIDVHVVLGRPGTGHRVAQRGWERAHVRRRVVLTVPYLIIAAMAAAKTDCVAAVPSRMADLCVRLLPLKRVRAMFPLPRINTVMVWHQRTNEDRALNSFGKLSLNAGAPDDLDDDPGRGSGPTGLFTKMPATRERAFSSDSRGYDHPSLCRTLLRISSDSPGSCTARARIMAPIFAAV